MDTVTDAMHYDGKLLDADACSTVLKAANKAMEAFMTAPNHGGKERGCDARSNLRRETKQWRKRHIMARKTAAQYTWDIKHSAPFKLHQAFHIMKNVKSESVSILNILYGLFSPLLRLSNLFQVYR